MTDTIHVLSNVIITTKQLFEALNFGIAVFGDHAVSRSIATGYFNLGGETDCENYDSSHL
jgi:hypothetical protein